MSVRRLVLLRHGQTEHNATSRMQGQLDTALSELGRSQAWAAGRGFANLRPHVIVSSDLRRAYETATAVGAATGTAVRLDARLRETDLGEWQGRTHYEVDAVYPGARERWRADASWAPPGGESRVRVAARAVAVIEQVVAEIDAAGPWGGRPALIVAHGGLIAAATASLLRLPVGSWPVLGSVGNTSRVELSSRRGPGGPGSEAWRLDVWNAQTGEVDDDGR